MVGLTWKVRSKGTSWVSSRGHTIAKLKIMWGNSIFLLYQPGQFKDGGDYQSYKSLKEAKEAAGG